MSAVTKHVVVGLALGLAAAAAPGAPAAAPAAVAGFDPARYAGEWYEIARIPNRLQAHCVSDVVSAFVLQPGGGAVVRNRCRADVGRIDADTRMPGQAPCESPCATPRAGFMPAVLTWQPWVWADFRLVELDADYRYAVVGSTDRRYLWVLSRTPKLEDNSYRDVLQRMTAKGYDARRLVRTEQSARPAASVLKF